MKLPMVFETSFPRLQTAVGESPQSSFKSGDCVKTHLFCVCGPSLRMILALRGHGDAQKKGHAKNIVLVAQTEKSVYVCVRMYV